jgi:hypothetical protein
VLDVQAQAAAHTVVTPFAPELCLLPILCLQTTCCNFRFRTKDAKCGTGTAAVTLADNCRDNNRPFRVLRSSGGTTCRCKNAM